MQNCNQSKINGYRNNENTNTVNNKVKRVTVDTVILDRKRLFVGGSENKIFS